MSGTRSIRVRRPRSHRVPYCERFQAAHLVWNRDVELRLPPKGCSPEIQKRFLDEFHELSSRDDPALLPVLDRGTTGGRPFYLVPFREGQDLGTLSAEGSLDRGERIEVALQLAAGMAAMHLSGEVLGGLDPGLVAWERNRARLHFLHHRGHPGRTPWPESEPRPEALTAAVATPSAGSDVWFWGLACYRLLADGALPFGSGSRDPEPIRRMVPDLPRDLAHLVEACLAPDPATRPKDGAEVFALLREAAGTTFVVEPVDESGSIPIEKVEEAIRGLRSSGSVPVAVVPPAPVPPSPSPTDDVLGEEIELESDSAPTEVSGLIAVTPVPESPTTGAHRVATPPATEIPSGSPGVSRAVPATVLSAVLFGLALAFSGGDPAPPVSGPAPTTPGPAPTVSPPESGLLELAPSQQAAFREDPYLTVLLEARAVEGPDFDRTWKLLRSAVLANRLPRQLNDAERLLTVRDRFRADPEAGSAELARFLDDLREVLGVAPPVPAPGASAPTRPPRPASGTDPASSTGRAQPAPGPGGRSAP